METKKKKHKNFKKKIFFKNKPRTQNTNLQYGNFEILELVLVDIVA